MLAATRRVLLTPLAALLAVFGLAAGPAHAAAWESSERWGSWENEGYTLYNNIWGEGYGTQTIWADSYRSWGVHADHPDTGGIKSYPNAKWVVDRPLSEITTLTSSYDVTVPSGGAYNTSYDIWDVDYRYEIMLWVNQTGPVGPLGEYQATVDLGGHTWDVYRGNNGNNEVFSFLRTADSQAGTVDILPVLRWVREQGWWGDVTVGDVQFGYEITSSAGGMDFTTNDFEVTEG